MQRNSALNKLFIEKIKEHPELWSSKKNVSKGFVAKIWFSIAEELGVDDPIILKKRWRNLKDNFRKEMKKTLASTSTTYPYVPQWKFYEDLLFLKDDLIEREKSNPFNWVELEAEESGTDSDTQRGSDFDEPPRKIKKKKDNEIATQNILEPEPSCSSADQGDNSKKFEKILKRLTNVSELVDKKITKVSSEMKSDDIYKNDPDYLFLISILPTIKRMSEIQKFQFRGKINDWLLEALTQNEMSNECDNKIFLHERDNLSNYD